MNCSNHHLQIQEVANNLTLIKEKIQDGNLRQVLEENIQSLNQMNDYNRSSFFLHNKNFQMVIGEFIDESPEKVMVSIGKDRSNIQLIIQLDQDDKITVEKRETSKIFKDGIK